MTAAILMIGPEVNKETRKGEPNDFQPLFSRGDATLAGDARSNPFTRVTRTYVGVRGVPSTNHWPASLLTTHQRTSRWYPSDVLTFPSSVCTHVRIYVHARLCIVCTRMRTRLSTECVAKSRSFGGSDALFDGSYKSRLLLGRNVSVLSRNFDTGNVRQLDDDVSNRDEVKSTLENIASRLKEESKRFKYLHLRNLTPEISDCRIYIVAMRAIYVHGNI